MQLRRRPHTDRQSARDRNQKRGKQADNNEEKAGGKHN